MGYYSIYKIFKDIIRTIFGKKFLIMLFLFILLFSSYVILFKNKSSAYSSDNLTTVTLNDTEHNLDLDYLTSQYNYYLLCWRKVSGGSGYYYTYIDLYCSDEEMTFFSSGTNKGVIAKSGSDLIVFHVFRSSDSSYSFNNAVYSWNNTVFDPTLNTHTYANGSGYNISQSVTTSQYMAYLTITLANYDVKDQNNNNIFNNNVVKDPSLATSLSDLESLNFDVVSVNGWSYSDEEFYILFYDKNSTNTETTDSLYPKRAIKLSQDTDYFQASLSSDPSANSIYWIPINEIGLNLYIGGTYQIRFAQRIPKPTPVFGATWSYHYIGETTTFTISSSVSQDKITSLNNEIKDTTEQKYHDETINSINNVNNNLNNINNALTNTNPDPSLDNDIDDSLDFNNQNEGLNNLNNGFFSRLTTMLSNLLGYDLSQDTSVSLPLPNSDKSIILHSNVIYNNVNGALRVIINAFWVYIFTFYMWKFINKIYIAISTGNILDTFSSSGEAITNDML